jgi:hypothetical protein
MLDKQMSKLPGLPGPRIGILFSPVRDNQNNLADDYGDFWTYAFRDIISGSGTPNPLTNQAVFDRMVGQYYDAYGSRTYGIHGVAPSPNPNLPDKKRPDRYCSSIQRGQIQQLKFSWLLFNEL